MEKRKIDWEKVLIGAGILAVFYYLALLFRQIYITKDGAVYVLLAQSLASGQGYIDNFLPRPLPHTSVPPGYPFILSVVIRMVGYNVIVLRALNVIFTIIALALLIKVLRKNLDARGTAAAFVLFAFNPVFVSLTSGIDSDILHLLFLLTAILLFANGAGGLPLNKFLIGALAIIAAFYMRMAGLALYLSALVYLLMRRNRRQFFLFAALGLLLLPWCNVVFSGSQGYGRIFLAKDINISAGGVIKFLDIPLRAFANLRYYSGKVICDLLFYPFFKEVTFGNPFFPVKICLSLLFSALFLTGFARSVRKGVRLPDLYIVVYMCMLLLWTYHDERFLIPLYPFLLIYMFDALTIPAVKYLKKPILLMLVSSVIIANFGIAANMLGKKEPPQKSTFESYEWIKNNTSPGAIIMSDDSCGMYLYSRRKGAQWAAIRDPDSFFDGLKKERVDYLLTGRDTGISVRGRRIDRFETYLKPVIERHPGCLEPVYRTLSKPEVTIYKIKY